MKAPWKVKPGEPRKVEFFFYFFVFYYYYDPLVCLAGHREQKRENKGTLDSLLLT